MKTDSNFSNNSKASKFHEKTGENEYALIKNLERRSSKLAGKEYKNGSVGVYLF